MPELLDNFDDLYQIYSQFFPHTNHPVITRATSTSVPDVPGVYLIWRQADKRPLCIGCSGKIKKGMVLGGGTVRRRLFGPSTYTPYIFDFVADVFRYGPHGRTIPNSPPKGYYYAIALKDIWISVIATQRNTAPAALEHLLIQGYINQHGDLPDVNQEI